MRSCNPHLLAAMALLNPSLHALPAATTPTAGARHPAAEVHAALFISASWLRYIKGRRTYPTIGKMERVAAVFGATLGVIQRPAPTPQPA